MSLIEQALRRIKDPLVSQPAAPAAPPAAEAPKAAPPTAHSWPVTPPAPAAPQTAAGAAAPETRLTAVTAGLVFALTVLLAIGGTRWMTRALPNAHSPAQPQRPAAVRAAGSGTASLPSAPAESALALTGIVGGEGEHYAVINGVIVTVGEMIDGWTLMALTEQSATLRRRDEERTLRVPRS